MNIHRTKLEKADELWCKQIGTLLSPPSPKDRFDFEQLKTVRLTTENEKKDIMISGLGFVTVDAGAELQVIVPQNVEVTLRPSIM